MTEPKTKVNSLFIEISFYLKRDTHASIRQTTSTRLLYCNGDCPQNDVSLPTALYVLSIHTTCVGHQHNMCGHSTHWLKIRIRVQKCLHLYNKTLITIFDERDLPDNSINCLLLDKLLTVLNNHTLVIPTYTLTSKVVDRCILIYLNRLNILDTSSSN
ncbi:Uncharacterised protein [Prevotella melaninogenica]|nr:Uncharacterised protein [Prevotella melaninogenica]